MPQDTLCIPADAILRIRSLDLDTLTLLVEELSSVNCETFNLTTVSLSLSHRTLLNVPLGSSSTRRYAVGPMVASLPSSEEDKL